MGSGVVSAAGGAIFGGAMTAGLAATQMADVYLLPDTDLRDIAITKLIVKVALSILGAFGFTYIDGYSMNVLTAVGLGVTSGALVVGLFLTAMVGSQSLE